MAGFDIGGVEYNTELVSYIGGTGSKYVCMEPYWNFSSQ
jgi:hypothetical protein